MRKAYKYILRILAVFSIYALSSFGLVSGQSLSVFIFYGEDAVSYVESCQGSTLALTVQAFGGSGTGQTFTWTGDTNPLYFTDLGDLVSYKNTTPAGTYNLTVNVTDDGGFSGSASVTVVIKPSPLADIVANGPTTFCEGNSVELEETNGQADVTYQWQKNFANITGATNFTYDANASGNYRVKVTGSNGCSKYSTTIISVTVNSLPSATASNDGPACYNGTINLTSGPAAMTSYTWTSTSATPFSSTLQNPSLTNVTPNNSGDYTVKVKDANGCENSAVTSVVVYSQLSGGTIGSDQAICYGGDPAAFTSSVSPSGGNGSFTYSWESKVGAGAWTAISGATGLTYDVPSGLTQTTMYHRVATNSCGTVYSNDITVTVYAQLNGGTIGSDQSICYGGDPAAFTSSIDPSGGNGAFTYSWESKVGAGAWTPIAGATGLTYNVPSGLTQTTLYHRVATNGCGTVYSNDITVTVYSNISGGVIAADQSVCYNGDPAAFTDATSPSGGNGAFTYSWESKVGAGAWTPIGGATAITYDIPAGITQTTNYRRVSTNACGSANSNELIITVYSALNGGTIAGDQTLCYNSDPSAITSSVDPSGGHGTWIYAWEYQVNCVGAWTPIAGATGLTYDPPANQTETRCYRRVATNDCGTIYSNTITITIYANIDGGTIASDQTVCYGSDPVAFTSTASASGGNGAFTYSWEQNTGSGWSAISGASSLTYDPPAGITQTTQYRRSATNSCGTGYSNTITVTVSNAIDGGQISSPAAVCYNGDPDAFTNVTSPSGGSGVWIYSWESKVGAGAWTLIAGASALTYDIPAGQTQTIAYRRVATNDCGTGYSNEVTVTVYPDIVSGSITGSQTYCYNSDPTPITSVTLPSGGDGNWTYAWEYQVNCAGGWISIPGATSTSYDPPANQTETRCYRRVEINACNTVYSNTVTITIIPAITGNTISSNQTICSGTAPAQLTGPVPSGGSGSFSYRWQSSTTSSSGPFSNISGATSQNYSPPVLTQTTYYRRVVTSGSCISISNVLTITVNPPIANNTITQDQTICYNAAPNQLDGSAPTGASGVYTYLWQSSTAGASGPFGDVAGATSINYQPGNLTQDTWYRRIVSSTPCSDNISNVIKITVSPEFKVTGFATTDPTCNGYSDGQATVNVSGGIPPYAYSWSTIPVQTTSNATGLSAGISYTVVVTDASSCTATDNVTLSEPAAISLGSVTVTPVSGCFGDSNGAIQIDAAGGTPNYTYSLFDGVTLINTSTPIFPAAANFGSLPAGTYSVIITDANSCPGYTENNIVVSEPAQIIISDVQTTPISCSGYTDGTITIIASGGTGALEYSVDGVTYQASNVFTVGEGYYDIFVRDANGCTASWPNQIIMVEPSAISFNYEITNITTCNGDNAGKISITNVSGGSGTGYEYSIYVPEVWGTNPLFENLPGGATNPYYIKVKDSYGCIEVGNNGNPIYINQPAPITFNVVTTDVTTCWYNTNGTIKVNTVAGGTGSKQVSIDGITYYPTTKTFNVGVGTYTVYVRDANGCIATKPAVISGPPAIVVDALTVTDASCFGAADGSFDASASGGTPPLEYSIDGIAYQAGGTFSGLSAATYTLYVRDLNGCVLNQDVIVGQPAALYFTTQQVQDITCNGLSDGEITLVAAGGNAPYNYSITGGAPFGSATGVFTGLSAGNYIAAVQDSKGCSTIGDNLKVVEPAVISIIDQSSTDILCFGETNGTVTVHATGGTNPLVYNLLDAGLNIVKTNSDGNFTGVAAGTYTVEINDANSCGPISAGPFTINEPTQLSFTYTTVDLTCHGDASGQITVNASGGTPAYEYSFDGGVTFVASNVMGGLNGGDYTVIVRDANGCESNQVVSIVEPSQLLILLNTTDITCNGLTNGQIDVVATGGTILSPYQYRIDGGAWQASSTFSGLSAGTYFVEVMDANGCISGDNASIVEPSAIVVDNIIPVNPTCTTQGSITVTASGGTGTLTYTINPLGISNTSGFFGGLGAGDYTVDITDDNVCGPTSTGTISLVSPSTITIDNVLATDVSGCYGNTNGSIEIQASGGTPPLNYSIDGGTNYQASNIFTGLTAGDYIVVVNDINDCPQAQPVTISEPAQISIDNVTVIQESTPGNNDGEIHVLASGGTGTLTYTLQPNAISNLTGDFTGLGTGTYYVEVTDDNNCKVQTSNILISGVDVNITSTDVKCNGNSDGTITINITGGFPPFTVTCSRVSDSQTFPVTQTAPGEYFVDNLNADIYIISITDAIPTPLPNRQVTISEPGALTATYVDVQNPTCNGLSNGSVEFSITGGTPAFMITWDGGSSVGNIATGVSAGSHEFTITDSNGCLTVVSDVPELVEPSPIQILELTQFDPTCNGEAIGLINVTATGGTGTLTYTISGMVNTSNDLGVFADLPAGVYDLTITDANGCVANLDPPVRITLSEPSPIIITGLTPEEPLVCPNVPEGYVRIQVSGGQPDYSFLWSNGQTTVDLENVVVGDYTVKVTDALNCQVSKTFTVDGPAMLDLTAVIDSALCRIKPTGDDGRIEITGSTGGNGDFADLSFLWNDVFSTAGPILGNISGGTYTLNVTDTSDCVYSFDYEVPIKPRYDFHAVAGNDTTVCYDNPVTLHGSHVGGASDLNFTYEWFELPNTATDEPVYRGADYTVQLTESKSYLLQITTDDEFGCLDNTTINLSVYPEIGLEVPMYISAVQDTIISVLLGKEYNLDVITKSIEYQTSFEWKPGIFFKEDSLNWNSSIYITDELKKIAIEKYHADTIMIDPTTKRPTEFLKIYVIATTEKGCVDSLKLYARIVNKLYFGNVFSPNGDGINDVWRVPKDYLFPDLEIEIFNRWGSLVWSAKGDKAAKGWDGRTNNGKELPIGTYYYIIKYNTDAKGADFPLTGSVTIVK